MLKLARKKTGLPVIADPSHATGIRSLVLPLAKAILAVGADGIMVETNNNPAKALCDGAQSLNPEQFKALMGELRERAVIEKKIM
jgi:3-deoxy-7-phosphoheptulonate synthase